MQNLYLEATNDTPGVLFDPLNEVYEITGRFLHEDATDFFRPILDWLTDYSGEPQERTIFAFKMNYFNTAASKAILDILMILEEIVESGYEVLVHWHFPEDDPDMEEAGIEYSEMVDVAFKLIPYQQEE
ncbi:MAG: nuclear pore complex subunit [Bacteroidia bacterium]|nr:MAG: nuclear pore complex subunit [Bacteroidia bacterium]